MTKKAVFVLAAIIAIPFAANAAVVDLATSTDGNTPDTTSGTVGGVIFEWTPTQPTGTGFIDSFVQIQPRGNEDFEQAYNTTVNNVFDNGSSDQFNHELALADIPIVSINGVDYRQFLLDINESLGQDGEFLDLDEVQILQSDTPNTDVETFTNDVLDIPAHAFVYRLDDGEDSTILLNAALNSGSGSGDMFMYVPDSLFTPDLQFVYLYSAFSDASAGFEEWAVIRGDQFIIPEPTTMSLLGLGLLGFASRTIRKRRA